MAIKKFPISWLGVYRASSNSYYGGTTIRVGSSSDYQSYLGTPAAVKEAINSSRTAPKLSLWVNATDYAEFDIGAHKETTNKASGTMPWYTYLYAKHMDRNGWWEFDLTSSFMAKYKAGTWQGVILYGGNASGTAYGLNNNSNDAYFEVEGSWNEPPTKPSFKTPVASTVGFDNVLVSWNASTDAEKAQNLLTYQLRYFNGTKIAETWNTAAGATSHSYPLSDKPETNGAYFEIRAYDGEDYSDWVRSSVFTVAKNIAPSMPTQLSPAGGKVLDRAQIQRFSWKHNDQDTQAGYKLAWRTISATGVAGSWNYAGGSDSYVNSTDEYHEWNGGTFPLGEIEWTVRTKDQQNLESPWSQYQRVIFGTPTTAPNWLYPTSGSLFNSSSVTAEWSSLDQSQYELALLTGNGAVLWSETGTTAKRVNVPYQLQNNAEYSLRVRVMSSASGLWSPYRLTYFNTSFVAPSKPDVIAETEANGGTISISWTNGIPSSVTVPTRADILRREYNAYEEQEWEVVAKNLSGEGSWIDFTPASDIAYQYIVRVYGGNDTSTDSDVIEVTVEFEHAYLHRALDLGDILLINIGDARDQSLDQFGELMFFANRRSPVFEFSINEKNEVNIDFLVDSPAELKRTVNFLRRRETFLYRDNNGRRFYCVVSNPKIKDRKVSGFEVSMTLTEVDFVEVRL